MKTTRFFIAFLLFNSLLLNTTIAQPSKANSEKTIRDLFVAMDAGQTDKFDMYCAPDFKIMNPFLTEPSPIAAFKGILQSQKTAFPDIKHEITEMVSDGKNVVTKGIFCGTNTGSMMGNPPSGNKVKLPFLVYDKLNDQGKLVDRFVQFDMKSFESQLMASKVSVEQIKKNCWAAYDALNRRDYDAFKKTVTADFTEYTAGPAPIKGVDACLETYKQFFAMAPDMKFDIKNITVDGSKIYVESNVTGTNTGMVMGILPASGKKVKTMDVDILTINAEGKAASHATANPNEFFHQIGYGSLVNPNTGIVMAIFEKFQKRDIPAFLTMIDDGFEFDAKDHPVLPRMEAYKGKTEFTNWVKEYNEKIQNVKLEPQRFFADGDDVMVTLNVEYILKSTGKSYSTPLVQHWRFRDGKAIWLKAVGGKPMEIALTSKK